MFKRQIGVLLILSALVPVAIAARPYTAYAGTAPATHVVTACKAPAAPLSDGQMALTEAGAPIDAICYIVGACVGFWPIGTLICGPTGIGCLIHYWQM